MLRKKMRMRMRKRFVKKSVCVERGSVYGFWMINDAEEERCLKSLEMYRCRRRLLRVIAGPEFRINMGVYLMKYVNLEDYYVQSETNNNWTHCERRVGSTLQDKLGG